VPHSGAPVTQLRQEHTANQLLEVWWMRERIERWWRLASGALHLWRQRRRGRTELSRMTDAELKDAGIDPHEAWLETRKSFWGTRMVATRRRAVSSAAEPSSVAVTQIPPS